MSNTNCVFLINITHTTKCKRVSELSTGDFLFVWNFYNTKFICYDCALV